MLLKILSGKCQLFCLHTKVDSESLERVFNRLMVVTLEYLWLPVMEILDKVTMKKKEESHVRKTVNLPLWHEHHITHYTDVIMSAMASQITSLTIVYSTVYSGANQRKHQSSASLAFVTGTGEFPAQRASNAENVSIWWRYDWVHGRLIFFLKICKYWQKCSCSLFYERICFYGNESVNQRNFKGTSQTRISHEIIVSVNHIKSCEYIKYIYQHM